MDLSPNSKSARPSEILRAQQDIIRQQDAIIQVLKGALAAAGLGFAPTQADWMSGLTKQEAALVGVLYAHYPRSVPRADIIEHLPGHDHARERQLQLVDIVVHKVRRKLGAQTIEAERGVGFRLSESFHAGLPKERLHVAAGLISRAA
jgi:DNA-binding response OmpR family regulator